MRFFFQLCNTWTAQCSYLALFPFQGKRDLVTLDQAGILRLQIRNEVGDEKKAYVVHLLRKTSLPFFIFTQKIKLLCKHLMDIARLLGRMFTEVLGNNKILRDSHLGND